MSGAMARKPSVSEARQLMAPAQRHCSSGQPCTKMIGGAGRAACEVEGGVARGLDQLLGDGKQHRDLLVARWQRGQYRQCARANWSARANRTSRRLRCAAPRRGLATRDRGATGAPRSSSASQRAVHLARQAAAPSCRAAAAGGSPGWHPRASKNSTIGFCWLGSSEPVGAQRLGQRHPRHLVAPAPAARGWPAPGRARQPPIERRPSCRAAERLPSKPGPARRHRGRGRRACGAASGFGAAPPAAWPSRSGCSADNGLEPPCGPAGNCPCATPPNDHLVEADRAAPFGQLSMRNNASWRIARASACGQPQQRLAHLRRGRAEKSGQGSIARQPPTSGAPGAGLGHGAPRDQPSAAPATAVRVACAAIASGHSGSQKAAASVGRFPISARLRTAGSAAASARSTRVGGGSTAPGRPSTHSVGMCLAIAQLALVKSVAMPIAPDQRRPAPVHAGKRQQRHPDRHAADTRRRRSVPHCRQVAGARRTGGVWERLRWRGSAIEGRVCCR